MASATQITAKQFGQMAFGETEDYELVDGELIPLPSGTPSHARIRDRALMELFTYFKKSRNGEAIAEIDCRLGEALVRRPDISVFLAQDNRAVPDDEVPVPFPPDIAIEVLSANETVVDLHRKVAEYLAAGTREVWIIDRQNAIAMIHSQSGIRRIAAGSAVESPLLRDFSSPLNHLFSNR